MTSHDAELLDDLVQDMINMKLSSEGSSTGVAGGLCLFASRCARDQNMIARIDPVFKKHRFNPIPVRVIIDKEQGQTRSLSQRVQRSDERNH
jgi:hypothetical protein